MGNLPKIKNGGTAKKPQLNINLHLIQNLSALNFLELFLSVDYIKNTVLSSMNLNA